MNTGDRRVWMLWSSLKNREQEHFVRWIGAELGTKKLLVKRLAGLLSTFSPPPETLMPIWKALYPQRAYDDGRMRKLLRELSQQLETFLSIQAFREDTHAKTLHLLDSLLQRKQPSLFRKTYTRYQAQLEKEPSRGASYYRKYYELMSREQRFQGLFSPKGQNFDWSFFTQLYDSWWMQERSELAFQGLLIQDRNATSYSWLDEDALFELIRHRKFDMELPLLDLYADTYSLLTQAPSDERANQLLDHLKRLHQAWPDKALDNLFTLLLNYFTLQLLSNNEPLSARILLRLYLTGIEMGWLLVEGSLPWNRLRNIINLALRVSSPVEVSELLNDLLEFVPAADKEEARHFHETNLFFAQGQYRQVIHALRTVRYKNHQYEIQARTQLIMSGYELVPEDTEWLLTQIASLRRYILQQTVNQAFAGAYLNQLRILGRLLRAYTAEELDTILTQIDTLHPLNKADWLRAKVKERLQSIRGKA